MCDIEELAIAVQQHQCLWNRNHEDYNNRELKDEAWETICQVIFKDWKETNETDRKEKFIDLKKKWTNVRDCYRREILKIKHMRNVSSKKKQKRYVHADVLSFLDPVFTKRHYKTYIEPEETQQDTGKEVQETRNFEISPSGSKTQLQVMKIEEQNTIKIKENEKEKAPSRHLSVQHQQVIDADEDSDDTKFLLSFRSDMRKMNSREKIEFKIGMLQLVRNTLAQSTFSSDNQIVYIENPFPSPSRYEQNIIQPSHDARHSRNSDSSSPSNEEYLTKSE